MNLFLIPFTAGAAFLLGFLLLFHPLQQNVKANRWLGFFVLIIGSAFITTYLLQTGDAGAAGFLFKLVNSFQFLLGPSLYISILFFVKPKKDFAKKDWLHIIPFLVYLGIEMSGFAGKESISTFSLFPINRNVSFLVRDILPFQALFYLVQSYIILKRHQSNLKLISSSIDRIKLDWLVQFLYILALTEIIWINDAFFDLPVLTRAMPFVYAGSIFFLAYYSIKQQTIFAFKETDIEEITAVLENTGYNQEEHTEPEPETPAIEKEVTTVTESPKTEMKKEKPVPKRLSDERMAGLSTQLISLMEKDRLFLDNELSLPVVAGKLGISIHEASFLINETARESFYNFINRYRVEEAKKLLASSKMEELNILGIAFAAGFNSKTTFNTTFKKMAGVSPTQYLKGLKNPD